MSLERIRSLLDLGSLIVGIAWGAIAVGVLHLPMLLFIAITVAAAFAVGWVRWGIRQRAVRRRRSRS